MAVGIQDFGDPNGPINGSMIKLSIGGGLRFDGHIEGIGMGWQISPSLGLVAKDVDRLALDIEDMKVPIRRSIEQVMIPSIKKNFMEEGRPTPWQDLAEYTVEVRGTTSPILVRTGALVRGVTQLSIWDISKESATVRGLPQYIWYGAIHQEGLGSFGKYIAKAKKQLGPKASTLAVNKLAFDMFDESGSFKMGIPQRQFLLFQEDDEDDIMQVFAEWLEDEAKRVGRFTGRSVRTVWGGPSW